MKGGRVQFIIGAAGFRLVIAPLFLRMEFGYRLGPGFFFFFFSCSFFCNWEREGVVSQRCFDSLCFLNRMFIYKGGNTRRAEWMGKGTWGVL
jgi:hypothetical protein